MKTATGRFIKIAKDYTTISDSVGDRLTETHSTKIKNIKKTTNVYSQNHSIGFVLLKELSTLQRVSFDTDYYQIGADISGDNTGDNTGRAVSLNADGTIIAIGADNFDGDGTNRGVVRVYQYSNTNWTQIGQDLAGDTDNENKGWAVSLNDAGDILAVGSHGNDTGGQNRGITQIYQYVNQQWQQLGADISGLVDNDWSGRSVSLNAAGTRVAIGENRRGTNKGSVRIFDYIVDTWTQMSVNDAESDGNNDIIDGVADGDLFGNSVSLNSAGNILAVGGHGNNAGYVRVYRYDANPDQWNRIGNIPGAANTDSCGYDVSINGDGTIIVMGSHATTNGSARVFEYVADDNWQQKGSTLNGNIAGDKFGWSVDINDAGNIIVVGTNAGVNRGYSKIYVFEDNDWTQRGTDVNGTALATSAGYSVATNSTGNIIAVGAIDEQDPDDVNNDRGFVRIYRYG